MANGLQAALVSAYTRKFRAELVVDEQSFAVLLNRLTTGQRDALYAAIQASNPVETSRPLQAVIDTYIAGLAEQKVLELIAAGGITSADLTEIYPYLQCTT